MSSWALTALEIVAVLAAILVLALAAILFYYRSYRPRQQVKIVRQDLRSCRVAIEASFVDDYHDLHPARGNYLPVWLTTPRAYLATLPVDPFSPTGKTYRYFDQGLRSNPTYVIASCGPDGDCDLDRLPDRIKIHEDQLLSGRLTIQQAHLPNKWSRDRLYLLWVDNVRYYVDETGQRIDVPQHELAVLPLGKTRQGALSHAELIAHLTKNNIAIYDPTNGLRSDGDIVELRR
jgi:type II secretory pathway pseudopilin PulG